MYATALESGESRRGTGSYPGHVPHKEVIAQFGGARRSGTLVPDRRLFCRHSLGLAGYSAKSLSGASGRLRGLMAAPCDLPVEATHGIGLLTGNDRC
jgi:hypothetical protein